MGKTSATPVELYLQRAKTWRAELELLHDILRSCGLHEALKWGKPCYLAGEKNLCILQPMKEFLALMYFQGALLRDEAGLLEAPGEHSQSGRRFRFTGVDEILRLRPLIEAYVREAVEHERQGNKVKKAEGLDLPLELARRLDNDPALAAAFTGLTPGRRRFYAMHIGAPKQEKTRESRLEACVPKILEGRGFHDR